MEYADISPIVRREDDQHPGRETGSSVNMLHVRSTRKNLRSPNCLAVFVGTKQRTYPASPDPVLSVTTSASALMKWDESARTLHPIWAAASSVGRRSLTGS